MNRAKVKRLARDLKSATVEELLGVATLLTSDDAFVAKHIANEFTRSVDVVGLPGSVCHKGLLSRINGETELWLLASGDKKIQTIKVIRNLTMMGLKEAKLLVDTPPAKVPVQISRVKEAAAELEATGAQVEIR